jgi:hypothetical protein
MSAFSIQRRSDHSNRFPGFQGGGPEADRTGISLSRRGRAQGEEGREEGSDVHGGLQRETDQRVGEKEGADTVSAPSKVLWRN